MEFVNIDELDLTVLSKQTAAEIQGNQLCFICICF